MKPKLSTLLLIAIPAGGVAYWLWANSRAATESPRYRLLRMEGEVEIREYPLLTVVNAPMSSGGVDGAFQRLFRYIGGNNARGEKIAMTTPVLMASGNGSREMSFIMPHGTVPQTAPAPLDSSVSVSELSGGTFAALRFGGGRCPENEQRAVESLRSLLTRRELAAAGDPIIAYYDPPWTPLFLRRNEVLIPIETRERTVE